MCDTPYIKRNAGDKHNMANESTHAFPCGKCPDCIKRRVNSWVFRLLQEEKRSTSAYFITLTYNNDTVPLRSGMMSLSPMEFNVKKDGTLAKSKSNDLTRYWKRLRKLNTSKIKYYAVGEYGSSTRRPHYHAIVFNVDDKDDIVKAWSYFDDELQERRSIGKVHIGDVSGDSIGYCAGYINKGKVVPQFKGDPRVPEFSHMSQGLGSNYCSWENVSFHRKNPKHTYLTLEGGVKIAMPRYYRDLIYTDGDKRILSTHIKKYMRGKEEKELEEYNGKMKRIKEYQRTSYEVYKASKTNAKIEKHKKNFLINRNKI